jgi:hypothetical protein
MLIADWSKIIELIADWLLFLEHLPRHHIGVGCVAVRCVTQRNLTPIFWRDRDRGGVLEPDFRATKRADWWSTHLGLVRGSEGGGIRRKNMRNLSHFPTPHLQ